MDIRSFVRNSLFSFVLMAGIGLNIGSGVWGAGIDLAKMAGNRGLIAQIEVKTGKVFTGTLFVVDSGHTLTSDNTSSGNFKTPFATLDYAIGQCAANNGDLIVVSPGHAETLAADSAVDIDVAGITVYGLGNGEDRPVFTFATAATADFKLAAANSAIFNLIFKCNIASQAMMIETSADDCEIGGCDFREGSATGLTFISVGLADGDSDRLHVHDCNFQATTAGNYDDAITVLFDMNGIVLEDGHIHGDFDVAGIGIPTAGNAQVDMLIQNWDITNLLTGQHAIEIIGTASTGKIINCRVSTDAVGTAIDAGGLEMFDNLFNVGTDQGADFSFPIAGESYIQVAIKNAALDDTDDLFDVNTGSVIVYALYATCEVDGDQSPVVSLLLDADDTVNVVLATGINIAAVNTVDTITITGGALAINATGADTAIMLPVVMKAGVIESVLDSGTSGAGVLKWHCVWAPLDNGATVTDAT